MATLTNYAVYAMDSRCHTCGSPLQRRGCVSCSDWDKTKHPRDANGHFGKGGQSASHPVVSGADDPNVKGALKLLAPGEGPSPESIRIAHPPALRGSPQTSTAWTDPDGRVFVNAQSRAYKKAGENPAELAAALAHEQFHKDHGAAEGPAYDQQLDVLRRLGAPKSLIADIQRSKDQMTSPQHQQR